VIDPQDDPNPAPPASSGDLDRALALVEFLRAHCPWDAGQTHHSLRRYLLEEAHEVVDAVGAGDDEALRDELGDLLLNLAFQVVIAEERSAFDRKEVVAALETKMRRRHPHLYGDGEQVQWERSKALERGATADGRGGLLADLLPGADPLAFAHEIQSRVADVGFDWADPSGAWAKVREEVEEVGSEIGVADVRRLEEEIGDLLFALVNFARLSHVHPTTALVRANRKFGRRFAQLESLAESRGIVLGEAPLETLDRLWEAVKGGEA
jgi:tetrapyrrole methylase family protein / MazG family protein